MAGFSLSPRYPMMFWWARDYSLGGTPNQRLNDHDEIHAVRHCVEIDNKVSKEYLVIKDYVKDNNIQIDFGGAITLRLIDLDKGLWLTSDGLCRNTKMYLLGLAFRNSATDKSIFDKYMFREDTTQPRLTFMTESGSYVSSNYRQMNDIINELLIRDYPLDDYVNNIDETLFNQNYYVLRQLRVYKNWVENHGFKSDDELLNAFENILNLYCVVYVDSINDVDTYVNNTDEVGQPSNGPSQVANKVLGQFQIIYCRNSNQNDNINKLVNTKVNDIFSPLRERCEPNKDNTIETINWVRKSYDISNSGYMPIRGTAIDVCSNIIIEMISDELVKYLTPDKNGEIIIDSEDTDAIVHIDSLLSNWSWHRDFIRINELFEGDDPIISKGDTRWIPLILKFERVMNRKLILEEKRLIQLISRLSGTFVSWKDFDSRLGTAINSIDNTTSLLDILSKEFISTHPTFKVDFLNSLLTTKGKDADSDTKNKLFNYVDRLLGHLMHKSNIKNWININPNEVGSKEMEHFLSRKYKVPRGMARSIIRLISVNFFSLPKSVNNFISNDDIVKKVKVIKGKEGTLGQLFEPNGTLESNVSNLLNTSEFDAFRVDGFDNEDWINITSVGVDEFSDTKIEDNLIYKYREVQVDNFIKKIFGI